MISTSPPKKQVRQWLGLYCFSALFLYVLMVYTTPYGVGASPDSVTYIQTARHLLHGKGLTYVAATNELVPLTHYPPLYPLVLAAGSVGVLDIQDSARLINVLSLAGVLTVAALVLRSFTHSFSWSTLGVAAIALSTPVVYSHWMVWSEPLFLFFTVLTFSLLTTTEDENGHTKLLLAAVTAGLAVLTRYAGMALVATGALFILFFQQTTTREKVLRVSAFAGMSASPLLLWLLYNVQRAGTGTNRSLAWHPVPLQRLADGAASVGAWFIPGGISSPWFGLALAAITLLLIIMVRPLNRKLRVFLTISGLFASVYFGFLLTSISLLDAYTPLDRRIMAPLNVVWLLCFILLAKASAERFEAPALVRWLPLALLSITITLNLAASGYVVVRSAIRGTDLATRALAESPLWSYLDSLPEDVVLISNAPDVIYLYTERFPEYVPIKYDMTSLRLHTEYEREMQALARRVEQGAVVIYLPEVRRDYIPDVQAFESLTGLAGQPVGDNALVYSRDITGDHR